LRNGRSGRRGTPERRQEVQVEVAVKEKVEEKEEKVEIEEDPPFGE
jgi:hypothetical protein